MLNIFVSAVCLLEVYSFKTQLFNVSKLFIPQMTSNPIYFLQAFSQSYHLYICKNSSKAIWCSEHLLCFLGLVKWAREPLGWVSLQISEKEDKKDTFTLGVFCSFSVLAKIQLLQGWIHLSCHLHVCGTLKNSSAVESYTWNQFLYSCSEESELQPDLRSCK